MSLKGKTLFITGASRGIGLAIALRAARDGANVAIAAKTDDAASQARRHDPHRRRRDREGRRQGAAAAVDVRDEEAVKDALDTDRGKIRRHRHRRQQCQRDPAHAGRRRPT